MTSINKRKFWQSPWGYPESIAVTAGIIAIGIILQLTVGSFNFYLLAFPSNLIIAGLLTAACVTMGFKAPNNHWVRWLSGVSMAVSLLMGLLILGIIMGFTPQQADETATNSKPGFDIMTRSWPFVLIYSLTLLSLGTLNARRLIAFRWRDYAFYLNHIGLWLLLMASGLGYADMERYVMYVREGETEWRVYDDENNIRELPLAIELKDFDMDVYPPRLAIIDRHNGQVLPFENPQFFAIDTDTPTGVLAGWTIQLEQYIHQAVRNSDSTYREVPMPGASPAVLVRAYNDSLLRKGWVCAGNQTQMVMTLSLDDHHSLVMTTAEPRSFESDIVVYTKDGTQKSALLRVNHPVSVGAWTIYQYGYDNNAGRLSSFSSFELVFDPWLMPVIAGIIMMMLGSVCMLWIGRKVKTTKHDLE